MKIKFYLLLALLGMITLQSCDNDDDQIPLPNIVEAYIRQAYPQASIKEIDTLPGGGLEVDIWDGAIEKELKFDAKNQWLSTSWDIHPTALPRIVTEAIKTSAAYNTYFIDDADYYETPAGHYYLLELEKAGAPDIYVKIDAQGNFLK